MENFILPCMTIFGMCRTFITGEYTEDFTDLTGGTTPETTEI